MSAWRRIGLNITRCGDWPTSCMIRRPKPFPLRTAPDHGLSNAGGNVDNKVFIPSSRPQVGAQGAEECLHLLAPHFAHVHEMSFRIKYLCAVAIKPSSNHQKKLANVSIAAYFLLGPAIAPDMWASRTVACPRPEVCRWRSRSLWLISLPPQREPRCEAVGSPLTPRSQVLTFLRCVPRTEANPNMFSACFSAPPCLRVKKHPPTRCIPARTEPSASRYVRAIADGGSAPHRESVQRQSPGAEFPRDHQGNESLPARVPAYAFPVSETFSSDSDQYPDSNRPAKPQGLAQLPPTPNQWWAEVGLNPGVD